MAFRYIAVVAILALLSVANAEWNKLMEGDLFEGDIEMTPELAKSLVSGNAYASTIGRQWPGGIVPYVIGISSATGVIKAAIAEYHAKTCLKFVPRTNQRAYVYFTTGSGCSSPVGYHGRRNDIKLAWGCRKKGIVMHEIGHSIGLYHEQSRPDRDDHVTIMWNNIKSGKSFNFNKYNTRVIDSLGTPYDFSSMMHYSGTAFSNGFFRKTIVAKDSRNQGKMGQRGGFSKIDVQQINLLYKCNGGGTLPTQAPPECKNHHARCQEWADRGECKINPRYMLRWCKLSCKVC